MGFWDLGRGWVNYQSCELQQRISVRQHWRGHISVLDGGVTSLDWRHDSVWYGSAFGRATTSLCRMSVKSAANIALKKSSSFRNIQIEMVLSSL
jgi:hypothetical protein